MMRPAQDAKATFDARAKAPGRLSKAGFKFKFDELEAALRNLVG
jgi:NAD dependent epimerase/dehydratase family enzyme